MGTTSSYFKDVGAIQLSVAARSLAAAHLHVYLSQSVFPVAHQSTKDWCSCHCVQVDGSWRKTVSLRSDCSCGHGLSIALGKKKKKKKKKAQTLFSQKKKKKKKKKS